MSAIIATGALPTYYREVFDACSPSGGSIERRVLQSLLESTNLNSNQIKKIWNFVDPGNGPICQNSLYKCLTLIAWTQQGKEITIQLWDNFSGNELPIPTINNLSLIRDNLARESACNLNLTYAEMKHLDTISVDRVPERIGIILKHSEYLITSKRLKTTVRRRYNDFLALYELLLSRFPYRLIPRLPPKKIIVSEDTYFLEKRRKGLHRWLNLIVQHPIISKDALIIYFLQDQGQDIQHKIKELFRRLPDEFMTSDFAVKAQKSLPNEVSTEYSSSREQIRVISIGVSKLKQIFDLGASRNEAFANNMHDLAVQLSTLGNESLPHSSWATGNNRIWQHIKRGFAHISKEFSLLSSHASRHATIYEEQVSCGIASVLDILVAHQDMCERLERGVLSDHNSALNKMITLKKRRMKGMIKGQDMESIDILENKMLEQEAAISSLELRHVFSMYCAQQETQLVHLHLSNLATVFNSFVEVNLHSHREMLNIWQQIHPVVQKFLPNTGNEPTMSDNNQ